MENKNYALFNYVNELNNQVELLQEQIDQVEYSIYSLKNFLLIKFTDIILIYK